MSRKVAFATGRRGKVSPGGKSCGINGTVWHLAQKKEEWIASRPWITANGILAKGEIDTLTQGSRSPVPRCYAVRPCGIKARFKKKEEKKKVVFSVHSKCGQISSFVQTFVLSSNR
jgi:hypothetical protein